MNIEKLFLDCNSNPLISRKVLFTPVKSPEISASYLTTADSYQFTTSLSGVISASVVANTYKVDITTPGPAHSFYVTATDTGSYIYSGSVRTGSVQFVYFDMFNLVKDPLTVKKLTLTPEWEPPFVWSGSSIVVLSSTSSVSSSTTPGLFEFDQLLPGPYKCDAQGPKVVTTFYISVPSWTSVVPPGSWNAKDLLIVKPTKAIKVRLNNLDFSDVLTVSSSDARYWPINGSIPVPGTSSWAINAKNAESSSFASSSIYSINGLSASFASSSTYSINGLSASYASSSTASETASLARSASALYVGQYNPYAYMDSALGGWVFKDGGGNIAMFTADDNVAIPTQLVMSYLPGQHPLITIGGGIVSASSITNTELFYLSGSRSNIQQQLDTLSSSVSPTASYAQTSSWAYNVVGGSAQSVSASWASSSLTASSLITHETSLDGYKPLTFVSLSVDNTASLVYTNDKLIYNPSSSTLRVGAGYGGIVSTDFLAGDRLTVDLAGIGIPIQSGDAIAVKNTTGNMIVGYGDNTGLFFVYQTTSGSAVQVNDTLTNYFGVLGAETNSAYLSLDSALNARKVYLVSMGHSYFDNSGSVLFGKTTQDYGGKVEVAGNVVADSFTGSFYGPLYGPAIDEIESIALSASVSSSWASSSISASFSRTASYVASTKTSDTASMMRSTAYGGLRWNIYMDATNGHLVMTYA